MFIAFDEGTRNESATLRAVAGVRQHAPALLSCEEIHVAGVHVDRRRQSGSPRSVQQVAEAAPIDFVANSEGQQNRGSALDPPAGFR